MTPQELSQDTIQLPSLLATAVQDYTWHKVTGGKSGVAVFALQQAESDSLYLKVNPKPENGALFEEKRRLEWAGNQLPVPQIRCFVEDDKYEYLLLSAITGVDASDDSFKDDVEGLVCLIAAGLRQIHALPITNCPFNHRIDQRLETARQRMLNGEVDESNFDAERFNLEATRLYNELLATAPDNEDLVFTHGDYCLPNIIIHQNAISGFIDWSSAGIADRYQDLSLAARSLKHNFGGEWVPLLFKEYGIEKPDGFKCEFYVLLDEFF